MIQDNNEKLINGNHNEDIKLGLFTFDPKIRLDAILTLIVLVVTVVVGYTRLRAQVDYNVQAIQPEVLVNSLSGEMDKKYISREFANEKLATMGTDIKELKELQAKDHDVLIKIHTELQELNKKR